MLLAPAGADLSVGGSGSGAERSPRPTFSKVTLGRAASPFAAAVASTANRQMRPPAGTLKKTVPPLSDHPCVLSVDMQSERTTKHTKHTKHTK